MEYIADSWFKKKTQLIVRSFIEQHGRSNGQDADWYICKKDYNTYEEGIYLGLDGKFHFQMLEDGVHYYIDTQQEARDCCVKYGYEPVDY